MATGFVQRFKGKIQADALYVKGQGVYGAGAAQSLTLASATASIGTINASGVTAISATSIKAIARLSKPTYVGEFKTIQLTTVSSGILITASTDLSVFFNGSTGNTTILSTLAVSFNLVATSTTNWAISGIYPSTLGALTLSAAT